MKKIICFFVLIFLFLQSVSAISSDLKESYSPGETAITEIYGNILEPITKEMIEFRRGHILVPFDYDVGKINQNYYLWFITPETQLNYTLIIKNITTTVSGKLQKINYEKNFSTSGSLNDYSVKPGLIITEKDFEIKVQLNDDANKIIEGKFLESSEITLRPGENILKFSITGINETSSFNMTLGKYSIPVYVKVNKTSARPGAENITKIDLANLTEVRENISEDEKSKIDEERKKYFCFEYPGKICAADETCTGQIITSADGSCCVGLNAVCSKAGETGERSLAWLGYLLGAVVIIIGVFIWLRYKKVKSETNIIQKIEKKAQLSVK